VRETVYGSDEWTAAFFYDRPDTMDLLMVGSKTYPCPGYGGSQVTRLVVQNKVAMSVAEAATTIG
jgi:hypothetical protein